MTAERFLVAGHRGAMALEPENSMVSFRRAFELGADEIELDVHLSKDGKIVVMHDDTLDRTTDGTGSIANLTWPEIKASRIAGIHEIPLLDDVLREIPSIHIQVEVKAIAATQAVLDLLEANPEYQERVIVISFHPEVLRALPPHPSPIRRGLVCAPDNADPYPLALELDVDILLIHKGIADSEKTRAYLKLNKDIGIWPINAAEDVRSTILKGFTRVTSDDPRIAMKVREELSR